MTSERESLLLLVVVGLAPFFEFFAANLHEGLLLADLVPYALATLAVIGLLYGGSRAVLGAPPRRVAAILAVATILVFNYHRIALAAEGIGASDWQQFTIWLGVLAIFLLVGFIGASKRPFQLFLLIFALGSLVAPTVRIAAFGFPERGPGLDSEEAYPLEGNSVWSGHAQRRPNIYLIVPDSYPSPGQLLDYYHFDDSGFVDFLGSRGFSVSRDTYSNYNITRLSIPSTLNMEYVFQDGEPYSASMGGEQVWLPGRTNRDIVDTISGDNRSVAFLRQLGYDYIHFEGRSFVLTRCRGYEDLCIEGTIAAPSELQHQLLSLTPYAAAVALSERFRLAIRPRQRSPSGTGIPELALALERYDAERPFFLYAHLATPHRPFLNDAECNLLPLDFERRGKRHFVNQVQCVNRHLRQLLERLLRDDPEALVILSSDHGPRDSVPAGTALYELSDGQIRESLGILSAFRLPADCAAHFRPELTPVNHMRLVFACLGGHPPNFVEEKYFIARPDSPDRGGLRRVEPRREHAAPPPVF